MRKVSIASALLGVVLLGMLVVRIPQRGVSSQARSPGKMTLASCLDPVECVFVTDVGGWPDQVRRIPSLRPSRVVPVSTESAGTDAESGAPMTPWTTDQWVFGWRSGKPVVLGMPWDCGLKGWGAAHARARGWPLLPLGAGGDGLAGRFDAGGNVLVTPGPLPWVITSAQTRPAVRESLRKALGGLDGRFIELDTHWLKVGHVDEIVSFVPDGETGFRLVVPDFLAGIRLLEAVPADRVLFGPESGRCAHGTVSASGPRFLEDASGDFGGREWKYVRITSGPQAGLVGRVRHAAGGRLVIDQSWDLRGESPTLAVEAMREWQCEIMPLWVEPPEPGSRFVAVEDSRLWLDGRGVEAPAVVTAGELRRDRTLHEVARKCARRVDGPGGVREILIRALRLSPADLLRLPVLVRGDASGQNVTALVPNPVNLVCTGTDVVLLRPHGPRLDPDDEASDVFARAWATEFRRLNLNPVFLEGWDALHRLEGGARCGINVLRRPRTTPGTGTTPR